MAIELATFSSMHAALLAAILILHNVTVIDGTGAPPRPHVDVVLRGERIEQLCDAATYAHPKEAKVLDLTGRFVIPGLVDMHAHVLTHPWNEKGELLDRDDRAATQELLRTMLAFGVTTIRDPGDPTADAVALRRLLAVGKIVGPELHTAGRILNASSFHPEPFVEVRREAEVRDEIRWQAMNGVDTIKVYSSMPPELVAVAIDEAHAQRLPIIGHLQRTTWTAAANLGIDGVEHSAPWSEEYLPAADRAAYPNSLAGRTYWLEHLDDQAIGAMIAALARHHVVVDPTLMAMRTKMWGDDPRTTTANPDLQFTPEAFRRGWTGGSFTKSWTADDYAQAKKAWPILLRLTKRMYDAGVPLVAGTDTPTSWLVPGASLHDELVLLRDAGIPPLQVLRIATSNAAAMLRRSNEFGAVRPGLRADLVVLDADPLAQIENTRRIAYVIQRGRIVANGTPAK
jgi:imidazolonepropionase-like amidohydrolase